MKKTVTIEEILDFEEQFRGKLSNIRPQNVVGMAWIPVFLSQSLLFSAQLMQIKNKQDKKKFKKRKT